MVGGFKMKMTFLKMPFFWGGEDPGAMVPLRLGEKENRKGWGQNQNKHEKTHNNIHTKTT